MPGESITQTENSLKAFARIVATVATVAIGGGSLVLLGWALDLGVLKSILPGFATMKANTAIGFALSGIALWLTGVWFGEQTAWSKWSRRFCAAVVGLIGLITVCEYILGWDLAIDELLFRDALTDQTSHPGRPSPATAFNFILFGAAFLLMEASARTKRYPGQWLALAVFCNALLAVLGYAYGVQSLYRIAAYNSMALHTAVLFMLLPIGLLCTQPERGLMQLLSDGGPGGTLMRRLLPAAILVPPIVGGVRLWGQREGFYGTEFGLALFAMSDVLIFAPVIWWTSRAVQRADTTRRTAEAGMAQLAAIVASSSDAIIGKDLNSIITSWNAGAEKLFGYAASEMLGNSILRLIPADLKDEESFILAKIRKGENVEHFETLRQIKDGRLIHVAVTASPIKDSNERIIGVSSVARDISERKASEALVREREERLRLATEAAGVKIWVWDIETGKVLWDEGMFEIYGLDRTATMEVPYQTWASAVKPEDLAEQEASLNELVRTGAGLRHREFRITRASDQAIRFIQAAEIALTKANGKVAKVVGINIDITERKRQEEELKHSNEALERSNMELKQFAYITSHDLQTPLRNIAGFVQLLKINFEGKLGEKADGWISRVVQSCEQMRTLIYDVLAYSRVDSRAIPFESVALRAVFDASVVMLEASINDASGKVTCTELPAVMGDRSQLVQLMQNLIGNGLKYRGQAPPQIHVSARRNGNEWIVSVEDNGIGIESKFHEQIFDIFKRLHNQQEYPGTGIGLAICRRVVHRHGGKIWVESSAGQGSTFKFTIPDLTPENK